VLRTKVDPQSTLWETMLPPEFLRLPPGLFEVDTLLDDPVFFEPFEEFFDPEIGRPSIPMETYLRMMFLRFRYRLGFETLCAEVADSLAWRRFCRVGLTDAVPHPTTLMKITTRCGAKAVAQLNEALLAKAHAAKVVKLDKVRADTTVVEANVSYPSDAGLLGKGVAKVSKLVAKLKAAGYGRTVTGIHLKLKRMKFKHDGSFYSASGLAQALGIDSHAVTRWIKSGHLKAKFRGTARTEQQNGDIYLIHEKDVRRFILEHPTDIDLRRVDQIWFLDYVESDLDA